MEKRPWLGRLVVDIRLDYPEEYMREKRDKRDKREKGPRCFVLFKLFMLFNSRVRVIAQRPSAVTRA
jgi:predicted adenine nucleotide alpha hydrolase (AANH) superfamily ATPase